MSDLFDDDRQELLLKTLEGHREVDDVDLDEDSRQEVGVGHACCHVQSANTVNHYMPPTFHYMPPTFYYMPQTFDLMLTLRPRACKVQSLIMKTTFIHLLSNCLLFFVVVVFNFEAVPLVEFMYLVFTCMPGESYRRRLRSLFIVLALPNYLLTYVFRVLINSLVC